MLNYLRLANETWTRGKWVFLQLAPGWIPSPTKRTPSSLFKFKPQVWFHYFNTHLVMWLRNTYQQRINLRWLEVFLNHRRIMSKALICFNLALLDHVRYHLLTCFQKWLKKKKICLVLLIDPTILFWLFPIDRGEWLIERRPMDFYSLDVKLNEFHGSVIDAQLPPRKLLTTRLESIQVCGCIYFLGGGLILFLN